MGSSIHHEEGLAEVVDGNGPQRDGKVMGSDRVVLTEDDVRITTLHSDLLYVALGADTRHYRISASGGKPTKSS
ncbi:hypothetical protein NPX13_g4262 [Xylaria arbuscula]|uniref:Uncharacterized protein n=1 Tax=Xylaria arbuscula TaxID=114810 RepID=A0A9W8NGP1_9PEZI|nr:hypothetical protein NPX13_g4262 [Xylaria arbuscula]